MTEEDQRLWDRFMEELRSLGLSSPEKARIPGISGRTLRRYLEGPPTRLEGDTKLAMASWLASRGVEGFGAPVRNHTPAPTSAARTEYGRQVDLVLQGPGTADQKTRMIESIAAGYRAAALEEEAAASRVRAAASQVEAEKAPYRGAMPGASVLSPEAVHEIWAVFQRALGIERESDAPPATSPGRDQPGG